MPQPHSACASDQWPLSGCTGRAWGRCMRSPFALQKRACVPLDLLQGKQGAGRLHLLGAGLVAAAASVTKLHRPRRRQGLPGSLCPLGLSPWARAQLCPLDGGALRGDGLSPAVPGFLRYRGPRKPAWIGAVPYVPCVPYRKSGWPTLLDAFHPPYQGTSTYPAAGG